MKTSAWKTRFTDGVAVVLVASSSALAGWQPGLKAGYLNSSWDTNSYPTTTEIQLSPHTGKTNDKPPWADNRTWIYTGQIYLNGSTYHFAESLDNCAKLIIDGTVILNDIVYNVPSKSGDVTLAAGWHNVEIRFGNGTGGAGPYTTTGWNSSKGFGYNIGGPDTTDGNDYTFPEDNGTMNLFRYDDGAEEISNDRATGVTTAGFTINGSLLTTNPVNEVSVYWGPTDGGTDAGAWSNRFDFPYPAPWGAFSTNVTVEADTVSYYRFHMSNNTLTAWADDSESVLSGEVTVQTVDADATEGTGDTGRFRVTRPETATNGPLTIYFTLGGTAVNSQDYFAVGNSVVIQEGEASVDIDIVPYEDLDVTEGDESVTFTLMAGSYIIGTASPVSLTLHDSGSPDQWAHHVPLIFTGHRGAETLTNFPVLVVLGTNVGSFSYNDLLSGEHDDLRFSDGVTANFLHYEVENWDTNGLSQVWVQVPAMTNGATIWAHWGRSGVTAPDYTTNGETWANNYVAVYHLAESGGPVKDSSPYGNGMVVSNNVQQGTNGVVGPAARWPDGSNDSLQRPSSDSLQGMSRLTLQTWLYDEQDDTQPRGLIAKRTSSGSQRSYYFFKFTNHNLFFYTGATTFGGGEFPNTTTGANSWYFAAVTYDRYLSTDKMKAYVDGEFRSSLNSAVGDVPITTSDLFIGILNYNYGNCWKGKLDEVRISNAARSAQWLQAEYLNMASNSLFQAYPGPTPSLFVDGYPVQSDEPSPAYGTTNLTGGEVFTCTAPAIVPIEEGVRYACKGYALYTNLVELARTSPDITCVYTNSGGADRLVWQWTTQYYVTFTNSGPGTLSPPGGWYDDGSVATCTATGHNGGQFVGWEDSQNKIPTQQAFASIFVPVTEPTLLTARFIPPFSSYGWGRRMSVTFSGYDHAETLTNFPVKVSFSNDLAGFFHYADMASPMDAGDLRFSTEDGQTELFYDIENWDTNGTSTVWVRLPALSTSQNRIYAYWKNPSQTESPVYTTNGIVWDNGYVAVYHLAEASGNAKDSSPFGSATAVYGNIVQGTNGIAGPAARWDGFNDWLYASSADSLHGMGQLTLQTWFYDEADDTNPRGLISKRVSSDNATGKKCYYFFKQTNHNLFFYVGTVGGTFSNTATGSNQWYFAAATYDKDLASANMKMYLDGALKSTITASTGNVPVYDSKLTLGILNESYGNAWAGKLDEIRISASARSADWLWAEYMNTASNAVFQIYSPAQKGTILGLQ